MNVSSRGEAILSRLGIESVTDPCALASQIVPAAAGSPFRAPLVSGLELLLRAVAERSPELAASAATRLVGLGPGRTPLGDDYLASVGLTVARLGGSVGFPIARRDEWLARLMPPRLTAATTALSARLIVDAVHGLAPAPVARLLRARDDASLAPSLARLSRIGATSGHGWAAGIGATAILLPDRDAHRPGGDATT